MSERHAIKVCDACHAKLVAIKRSKGAAEMIRLMPSTVCGECFKRLPGYQPGFRLTMNYKGTASGRDG